MPASHPLNGPEGRSAYMGPAECVALAVGVVFILMGMLGFLAELSGVRDVSLLHNLIHVSLGVVGVAVARTFAGARTYLVGGGAAYLALAVLEIVTVADDSANTVLSDAAADRSRLGLALAMIGLGTALSRTSEPRRHLA